MNFGGITCGKVSANLAKFDALGITNCLNLDVKKNLFHVFHTNNKMCNENYKEILG